MTTQLNMRITGGNSCGQVIRCPAGINVRPTSSKIRQAFFNILRKYIEGASFLDLYAGSGLMGIEALSRGAQSLIAVESNRLLVKSIEDNLKKLKLIGEVITGDVSKVMPIFVAESFDLIFADPPYSSRFSSHILNMTDEYNLLKANGILAIEHRDDEEPPKNSKKLVMFDQRHYGQTVISFFQHS